MSGALKVIKGFIKRVLSKGLNQKRVSLHFLSEASLAGPLRCLTTNLSRQHIDNVDYAETRAKNSVSEKLVDAILVQ